MTAILGSTGGQPIVEQGSGIVKPNEECRVESLAQIFDHLVGQPHARTKPRRFYELYDKYFSERKDTFTNVLELGVYKGESLRIFSQFFSNARILGVDKDIKDLEFDGNIECVECDQTDRSGLLRAANQFAPSGFDIVIDDASHIGYYSLQTFQTLFNKVKNGGYYVIEDWQIGYFEEWVDGARLHSHAIDNSDHLLPKRLPSHDFGMVGFVKGLVDILGNFSHTTKPFEYLHLYDELAIIKKKADYAFNP